MYNYGTFAFDSPTLVLDSVAGKLPYWLSVQTLNGTLRTYREQGRSLVASELELTPAERVLLRDALRENARPERRYYRYDYYRDNCATRVRDIVDRVIGGRMKQARAKPASMSYRAHTLRLVADDLPLYAGLDLAVGPPDRRAGDVLGRSLAPPERLHALFAQTTVSHGRQALPLIRSEQTLLAGALPCAALDATPRWAGEYAALGLALGCSFAVLGCFADPSRRGQRVTLGALYLTLGGALGLLGCALCYLTFLSFHSAAALELQRTLAAAVVARAFARGSWSHARAGARLSDGALGSARGFMLEPARALHSRFDSKPTS